MIVNDTIRVGFVGAGANTKLQHLPKLGAIDGVELVSVANRSRESGQRVADEWGLPTVYDNWRDLIAAPDTNAICIGTWPYMHKTLTLAALENDKHVLCEARMAMNSVEAREMLSASRAKSNLTAQIVPGPLSLKIESTIKKLIADRYLGDIISVELSIGGDFPDHLAPLHWREDRDLSGNNIMRLGIWYEEIMRYVGPARSVRAVTRVHVKSKTDESGAMRHIAVPDYLQIISEMESGPVMHVRMGTVLGLAEPDSLTMFGTEGTIRLDTDSMALYGGRRGDSEMSEIAISPEMEGHWRVEEEFVNAIRGLEEVTHTNFVDGVRYMEFTDAVHMSARTGETVYLPLQ